MKNMGVTSYGDSSNSSGGNSNGGATSNTIDDEFASLFLQELQNTRAESLKNVSGSVTQTAATDGSQPEVDYINSMELSASQTNLVMKGAASYAMYLPMETTFNSNFLDLNEIYSPGTQQMSLESLMKSSGDDSGVTEENGPVPGIPGDMLYPLKTDRASFPGTAYNQPYQQITVPEKDRDAISTILNMPVDHIEEKAKTEEVSPSKVPVLQGTDSKHHKVGVPEVEPELQVLQLISSNVLSLVEIDASLQTTEVDLLSKIQFRGSLAGRLYINPESFVKLSQLRNFLTLMEEANSTQLFCYRRNWISINFTMDLGFLKLVNGEKPFDEISISLSSSLRKQDNKDSTKVSVIKESEEFIFHKTEVKNFDNIIQASDSKITVKYDDLVKIATKSDDVQILWDQIKFKSATANNRHDAANKHYIIVLEVNFHKNSSDNDTISHTRIFESHQIIVRGRNPSFYSKKGDILIGKNTKLSGSKTSKFDLNPIENTDSSAHSLNPTNNIKSTDNQKTTAALNSTASIYGDYRTFSPAVGSIVKSEKNGIIGSMSQAKDTHDKRSVLKESNGGSSYQYFRVTDNYYLPPVDVGYFPHYVHHSKQVLKPNPVPMSHKQELRQQYNYYI